MLYQSPLHIIGGMAGEGTRLTRANLIRLRKQLLADLNLDGGTSLLIHNRSYTRDEIIKTFDVLLADPDLELHEFIYANKDLLAFFENENIFYTCHAWLKLEVPETLREKLLPLLKERFILQYKKAMSKRSFNDAREFVLFIEAIPEEHRDNLYEIIHNNLSSLTLFIVEITNVIMSGDNIAKGDAAFSLDEQLKFLKDGNFAKLLNTLPSFFDPSIENLVNSIINVMFYYSKQRPKNDNLTWSTSYMLMAVRKCDEEQYLLIRKNHEAYANKGSSSNYNLPGGILVFIVIIVSRFIADSSSCLSSNRNNNFKVYYDNKESKLTIDTLYPSALNLYDSNYLTPARTLVKGEQLADFSLIQEYVKSNIQYPQQAIDKGTSGVVHISFIVEPNGAISEVKALDSLGNGCWEEAVRVVKSMPLIRPATKNGKPIRSLYTLPVRFKLE